MSKYLRFSENEEPTSTIIEDTPIFIPNESYIEGYLKSSKSIKLECCFTGTIFTSNELLIEKSASMRGDAICNDLVLKGKMDGNIFCSGHVEFSEGSIFKGKIYTSTFKNLTQENSDFVVQIPNHKILSEVKNSISELNTDIGLTSDVILSKVRGLFYDNVFSARKNPHDEIINPFTEQLNKGGKKITKKRPVLTAIQEVESPQNKSGEGSKTTEVINKSS
tara:strand:+ start:511 stop:1173 length:663 start_codon:yes stop_codon:yes gene_type:complete